MSPCQADSARPAPADCHPAVVKAGCTQLETLNTNNRYLHPHILDYARRIGETFPGDLKVVFWVNSGSEANDLALRLARAHTRKRGVLCVDGAYHGHVTSIIDISPYKYDREGGAGERRHVRKAAIPDVFSGIYRGAVSDEALGCARPLPLARAGAPPSQCPPPPPRPSDSRFDCAAPPTPPRRSRTSTTSHASRPRRLRRWLELVRRLAPRLTSPPSLPPPASRLTA